MTPVLYTLKPTIITFAVVIALFSGCSKTPVVTANLECHNGGTSTADSCVCASGYTGKDCSDLSQSAITYINNAPTDVSFTVNGKTSVILSGDSITLAGLYGNELRVTATTCGRYSNGQQLGPLVAINGLSTTFPASGTQRFMLHVNPPYFLLQVRNIHGSKSMRAYTINAGTPEEVSYDATVPNDGKIYTLGYGVAKPGGKLILYPASASFRWIFYPTFSLSANEVLTLKLD